MRTNILKSNITLEQEQHIRNNPERSNAELAKDLNLTYGIVYNHRKLFEKQELQKSAAPAPKGEEMFDFEGYCRHVKFYQTI